MLIWVGATVAVALALSLGLWQARHASRTRLYRELAERRNELVQGKTPALRSARPDAALKETFGKEWIVRADHFLDEDALKRLLDEALANRHRVVRTFIPLHKKGATVSYENIHLHCPSCLGLYHSEEMLGWVSELVGQRVWPAGDHDQSACSLLFYDQAGAHINWHYDFNYYKGRQFTALLTLTNRAGNGGFTRSRLMYKDVAGKVVEVDTEVNSLALFEGARVLHRVSPAEEGDLRVVLSMTFNTEPRISRLGEMMRRIKDTAFYGLRVLWD
jgi:hypothetical protein